MTQQRTTKDMVFGHEPPQPLGTSLPRLGAWLDSTWREPFAPMHAAGRPQFLPTCFAILAAECSDGGAILKRHGTSADAVRNRQSADDGLFDMGPIRDEDLSTHSREYLRLQGTYFAIHALDALGLRPSHPIHWAEALLDVRQMRQWLDAGPWNNPWLHSNNIMFALTFLQLRHEQTNDARALAAFDDILAYLDERQDAESGLWQPTDRVDMENAVYAAYHFFPYYFWRGVRPRYVEQIIDSTLSIQKADGLYGIRIGGGACEDLDAVHTLVMMNLVSDHRAHDVRASLERCFWRLLQIQHEDGGFPNAVWTPPKPRWKRRIAEAIGVDRLLGRQRAPAVSRISGWRTLEFPRQSSDMWSAWFRPLSLKLIADHFPDIAGSSLTGGYRKLPGLGWHDVAAIRGARPRAVVARTPILR